MKDVPRNSDSGLFLNPTILNAASIDSGMWVWYPVSERKVILWMHRHSAGLWLISG